MWFLLGLVIGVPAGAIGMICFAVCYSYMDEK